MRNLVAENVGKREKPLERLEPRKLVPSAAKVRNIQSFGGEVWCKSI